MLYDRNMETFNRLVIGMLLLGAAFGLLLVLFAGGSRVAWAGPVDMTPTAFVYLPLVLCQQYECPAVSSNVYSSGIAYQYDLDDPVRPAGDHADKNLAMRSYTLNADPNLKHELVAYPEAYSDPKAPKFARMFNPHRVPDLVGFYQVYHWNWGGGSPFPGTRGDAILNPEVSALGLGTTPGEVLYVPDSGYEISPGNAAEVLVLFADADSITLKYTREDSTATGYTLHVDNICTDPNLLALYDALDDSNGPRYVYKPPGERPYGYALIELAAGQAFGTARGDEVVIAIVDTGSFLDPRSCHDWWLYRPGYAGTCPSP